MNQRSRRGKIMAEINITPFTDVVLVLLIIFMITTPLLLQPGFKIKMPNAKAAETETDKSINILINSKGNVYLNEKPVDTAVLKEQLQPRLADRPDQPVIIIKADKDVKYDVVIKVIDIVKQSGANRIALGVEASAATSPSP